MNLACNISRLAFLALLSALVPTALLTGAAAQEEQRSSATNQDQGSDEAEPGAQAAVAQVGAGTTDGSTTGYSGPQSNAGVVPGENSLPPLPSDDVCEPYRDTPAYQSCLGVVLRDEPGGTADD